MSNSWRFLCCSIYSEFQLSMLSLGCSWFIQLSRVITSIIDCIEQLHDALITTGDNALSIYSLFPHLLPFLKLIVLTMKGITYITSSNNSLPLTTGTLYPGFLEHFLWVLVLFISSSTKLISLATRSIILPPWQLTCSLINSRKPSSPYAQLNPQLYSESSMSHNWNRCL